MDGTIYSSLEELILDINTICNAQILTREYVRNVIKNNQPLIDKIKEQNNVSDNFLISIDDETDVINELNDGSDEVDDKLDNDNILFNAAEIVIDL